MVEVGWNACGGEHGLFFCGLGTLALPPGFLASASVLSSLHQTLVSLPLAVPHAVIAVAHSWHLQSDEAAATWALYIAPTVQLAGIEMLHFPRLPLVVE